MTAVATMFQSLFETGSIVVLILAGVCVEAMVLAVIHARRGNGIAPARFVANLVAGACLLLALRAALLAATWPWIAAFLLASFVAHVADLAVRWVPPGAAYRAPVRASNEL